MVNFLVHFTAEKDDFAIADKTTQGHVMQVRTAYSPLELF